MSANTQPITLPENYYAEWAASTSATDKRASVADENPFRDPSHLSRTTASGFTETTLRPVSSASVWGLEERLEASIEDSKRASRNLMIQPIRGKGKERQAVVDERLKQEESTEVFRDLARMTLERSRKEKEEEAMRQIEEKEEFWRNEKKEEYVTLADFEQFARRISQSVHPSESASVAGRMERIRPLAVTSSKLSGIQEMESDVEGTVIGGFDMTAVEKIKEVDAYTNIPSVRGLPRVYVNDRLNFLSHLHTALFRIASGDGGVYPGEDCLSRLVESRRDWGMDPETTLLKVVLNKTIDSDTSVVIANPFRLPILEPTMVLTTQIMHMCLDQLHSEFEQEYFNTVKTMTTPKFHSKYESRRYKPKEHRRRQSSGVITQSSSSSARSSTGGSSSRKSSFADNGSVLSRFTNW